MRYAAEAKRMTSGRMDRLDIQEVGSELEEDQSKGRRELLCLESCSSGSEPNSPKRQEAATNEKPKQGGTVEKPE
jgi:hypothetical protein